MEKDNKEQAMPSSVGRICLAQQFDAVTAIALSASPNSKLAGNRNQVGLAVLFLFLSCLKIVARVASNGH